MKYELKPLNDQMGVVYEEMTSLVDNSKKEKRELTNEENVKFDELNKRHTDLEKQLENLKKLNKIADGETANLEAQANASKKSADELLDNKENRNKATKILLLDGLKALSDEQRVLLYGERAQTITTTGGGYLIPRTLEAGIIESLKQYGGLRQVAHIMPTESGNPIDMVTNDETNNTGEQININSAANELDTVFGLKTLGSYKFSSKMIRVPNELLRDSMIDIEAFIIKILAERLGRITNTRYTTGNGSTAPEGATVGSVQGALTASATAITFNELLDLKHSVDPAYRGNGTWMFNDATLLVLKKLSMSDAYHSLWQPGAIAGAPSTIDGQIYTINNDMADIAANQRPVLYGDFKQFCIRDIAGMSIQKSTDRYIEYDQSAFLGFMRTDSKVLNSGAIKYLRMITT